MGGVFITDMTHFEGLPPDLADGPAGRIARYFGSIVSVASVSPVCIWVNSVLQCRRRPGKRICTGHIQVFRTDVWGPVEWHCSQCDDQGVISNWKDTDWDLSPWSRAGGDETELLDVVLSQEAVRQLQKTLIFSPEAEALVYSAIVTETGALLRATGEEMDDLLGYIAAEANHEKNRQRRKVLNTVCDRIEALVEEHLAQETGLRDEVSTLPEFPPEVGDFLRQLERRLRRD